MPCARNQSALLSRDQTFHWPCSQRNGAGEAVPGSWHVEDINAFPSESDSRSLPRPTTLRFFTVLLTPATQTPPPPNKEQRTTKSKVGSHAFPDHSLIEIESKRERNGKKGGENKTKTKGQRKERLLMSCFPKPQLQSTKPRLPKFL